MSFEIPHKHSTFIVLSHLLFRSSVDRGSGDTPRQAIDHEALVKSFGVRSGGGGSLETSVESGTVA